jgi:antitoxin (DNA-binding transcriptional repressor) of toxin-antitoxin stability system
METMMRTVNILGAKSSLSRLVAAIEQGREREIVITRNGRAVAKLVPAGRRLGIAKGVFEVPDIDKHNDEIVKLFTGGTQS